MTKKGGETFRAKRPSFLPELRRRNASEASARTWQGSRGGVGWEVGERGFRLRVRVGVIVGVVRERTEVEMEM